MNERAHRLGEPAEPPSAHEAEGAAARDGSRRAAPRETAPLAWTDAPEETAPVNVPAFDDADDDEEGPREEVPGALLQPKELFAGRFYVVRLLALGGMAEVYEAADMVEGRPCALKVLRLHYNRSEKLRLQMISEARALIEMGHPHIVEAWDAGVTPDGLIYIAMELLTGTTLHDRIHGAPGQPRPGRVPLRLALRWIAELAGATHALHLAGIIHRDLKPENVFVTLDGTLKILDLGAAKFRRYGLRTTGAHRTIGTPPYMSPEHLRGDKTIDGRSDVYSLGHVFYEVLAGEHAFCSPGAVYSAESYRLWQEHRRPEPLEDRRPGLPPVVGELVLTALEKKREDRWQSCKEIEDAAFGLLDALGSDGTLDALDAGEAPARAPIEGGYAATATTDEAVESGTYAPAVVRVAAVDGGEAASGGAASGGANAAGGRIARAGEEAASGGARAGGARAARGETVPLGAGGAGGANSTAGGANSATGGPNSGVAGAHSAGAPHSGVVLKTKGGTVILPRSEVPGAAAAPPRVTGTGTEIVETDAPPARTAGATVPLETLDPRRAAVERLRARVRGQRQTQPPEPPSPPPEPKAGSLEVVTSEPEAEERARRPAPSSARRPARRLVPAVMLALGAAALVTGGAMLYLARRTPASAQPAGSAAASVADAPGSAVGSVADAPGGTAAASGTTAPNTTAAPSGTTAPSGTATPNGTTAPNTTAEDAPVPPNAEPPITKSASGGATGTPPAPPKGSPAPAPAPVKPVKASPSKPAPTPAATATTDPCRKRVPSNPCRQPSAPKSGRLND